MKVWREKERVMERLENANSCRLGEIAAESIKEEELMLTGFLSFPSLMS